MRLKYLKPVCAAAAATVLNVTGLAGQSAQALGADVARAVADSLASLLHDYYIDPGEGARLATHIRERAAAGAFDTLTSERGLARSLIDEMRSLVSDWHLGVVPPGDPRSISLNAPMDSAGFEEAMRARAEYERARNGYFRKVEYLPGNVAVISFDQFPLPDVGRPIADRVMELTSLADAIIIDLSANRGGTEGLNQYLASYFFSGDTTLYTRYYRDGDSTLVVRTLPEVGGMKRPDVPLFLVVGRGTGSAAENFAYSLQSLGRATLVGDRTAGAAQSARPFPLPGGFAAIVAIARVLSPYTGTNWEGTGVQPDVRADPATAVAVAHRAALRKILETTNDEQRRQEIQQAISSLDIELGQQN